MLVFMDKIDLADQILHGDNRRQYLLVIKNAYKM